MLKDPSVPIQMKTTKKLFALKSFKSKQMMLHTPLSSKSGPALSVDSPSRASLLNFSQLASPAPARPQVKVSPNKEKLDRVTDRLLRRAAASPSLPLGSMSMIR